MRARDVALVSNPAGATPGAIVLFGSGETAGVGREALRWLDGIGRAPRSVAVLETPAGFEPNAEAVARRWTEFIARQPEAQDAEFAQLPLRRRGTEQSPELPELARPILGADLIALGAGSPSYTERQLRDTVAWRYLVGAHLMGASLFLASASAIAAGSFALPVYEIYKVGDDPHWIEGLGLFESCGLCLVVVTHWDNADGGEELDTSRCFMGRERFTALLALLPAAAVVVGIDEHTALALDPATGTAHVLGRGTVSVIREGREESHAAASTFPITELGPFALPERDAVVPAELAAAVATARAARISPPPDVAALIESRERARNAQDFPTADRIRQQLADRGWAVDDTPHGPRTHRA
jgi:hypothetical protein